MRNSFNYLKKNYVDKKRLLIWNLSIKLGLSRETKIIRYWILFLLKDFGEQ
jgi:hypothetical protein